MEIEGVIEKKVAENSGVSATTGQPWKTASYKVNITSPVNSGSMVFEVKDGMNGRIANLNLQPGKAYKLYIGFEVNEYKDKLYNRIVCWGARDLANIIQAPEPAPAPGPEDIPY